ncbi:ion channel [Endozoicomonas sp. Mp262]|uniref:potassium channel family protein n=1 Tax=Endozoicomonas sp. Mp262 TaxID=2919499 RepID=UPI0021E01176
MTALHLRAPVAHLTVLLLALITSLLLSPSINDNSVAGTLFSCLMLITLMTTLTPLATDTHRVRLILKITGIILILLRLGVTDTQLPKWVSLFSLASVIIFHTVLMVLLMKHLFSDAPQTEKLLAAINFYLLTGINFGFVYVLLNLLSPGAFNFPSGGIYDWPDFLYFSFVSLTTLGYGDIIPISPLAQSLAALEAVIGVLSPTVMIARFVK